MADRVNIPMILVHFTRKINLIMSVNNSETKFLILSFVLCVQRKPYRKRNIAVTLSLLKVFIFTSLLKGKKKAHFPQALLVSLIVINIVFLPE